MPPCAEEGGLGLLITGRGPVRGAAHPGHAAPHAPVGSRREAVADCLGRGAGGPEPGFVAIRDRPAAIWGGITMRAGEIMTLGPGQRVHSRTDGPSRSGPIWLPTQDLARYGCVDRSHVRRSSCRKGVAISAGGWQTAAPTSWGWHPHVRSSAGSTRWRRGSARAGAAIDPCLAPPSGGGFRSTHHVAPPAAVIPVKIGGSTLQPEKRGDDRPSRGGGCGRARFPGSHPVIFSLRPPAEDNFPCVTYPSSYCG
jgi:hypothetical protein